MLVGPEDWQTENLLPVTVKNILSYDRVFQIVVRGGGGGRG